jgi:hypothetical protein
MEIRSSKNLNIFYYISTVIIFVVVFFQLVAIFKTPVVGDEPDDFGIITVDSSSYLSFFNNSITTDQARLPFFISMPFLYYLGDNALIPLRIMFFCFHLFYLFFCYKIIKLLSDSEAASWLFVLLVATSCFIASFSIFSISTSDNLYLLFHITAIYYFIKSYLEYKKSVIFSNYVWLSLLLALCIASKLFGIFLLIALFIFFLINKGKKIHVRTDINRIIYYGIIFLFFLVLINSVQLIVILKLFFAFILGLIYLAIIVINIIKERKDVLPKVEIGWLKFWSVLTLTTFNLTLIFSPIYLNFSNIVKIFTWVDKWGWASGELTNNSHFYDIALIVLAKYGFLSSLLLLVIIILSIEQIKKKRTKIFSSIGFLFFLIFITHLLIVSWPEHKVTWYPLAIFPFLYLPIIWAFINIGNKRQLLYVFITGILVCNLTAYFYWFPYGQFDGAQYGRYFIGHNRAAIISFEFLPKVVDYYVNLKEEKNITINCLTNRIRGYNFYSIATAEKEMKRRGITKVILVSESLENKDYDYLVTSPIGDYDIDKKVALSNFLNVNKITWRGVEIVNIWKRR